MNTNHEKRISFFAVASLVCLCVAIISLLLFALTVVLPIDDVGFFMGGGMIFFPLAFVLSFISFVVIAIRRKRLKGYFITLFVMILSLPPIYVMCRLEATVKARIEREKTFTCRYNLRLLGKELLRYAESNGRHLPTAEKWCDSLMQHNQDLSKETFKHPLNPSLDPPTKSPLHPDFEETVQCVHPSFKLPSKRGVHLDGKYNFAFNNTLSGLHLDDTTVRTL